MVSIEGVRNPEEFVPDEEVEVYNLENYLSPLMLNQNKYNGIDLLGGTKIYFLGLVQGSPHRAMVYAKKPGEEDDPGEDSAFFVNTIDLRKK